MNSSFWDGVYRNWIWIGALLMLVAAAALWACIAGLVSLVRKSQLFRVPLAERQEIQFAEAGKVALNIEGPRFTTRFARVDFELRGVDGDRIESRRVLLRGTTSGLSKVRMELLKYNIPRPGRYVLIMTGLGAPQDRDREHAVVFTRPFVGQMVGYILGIILAFMVLITSLVFFVLRLNQGA